MTAKARDKGGGPISIEGLVWVCLAVAGVGTAFFLLREPEDGPILQLTRAMIQARGLAVGAAVIGSLAGLWRILSRPGDPNLFAMAALFNLMIACYWILRLTLVH